MNQINKTFVFNWTGVYWACFFFIWNEPVHRVQIPYKTNKHGPSLNGFWKKEKRPTFAQLYDIAPKLKSMV